MSADQVLTSGTVIDGDLHIVRCLGTGGMGQVYLARDLSLDRDVAVKVLKRRPRRDDTDSTDEGVRVVREARACARVVHPHVAVIYRVGRWKGRPYIEMEWVDGASLRQVLADRRDVDDPSCRRWLTAIASAVQHAHDCGVIHCDLKPENILIGVEDDGRESIKLVDFGLARGRDLAHRSELQRRGTAQYLPPEAGRRPPSTAGDQFSLAVLACELLTGARPERTDRRLSPSTHQGANEVVQGVLRRALAERAQDRFETVAAFAEALLRAMDTSPTRRPERTASNSLSELQAPEQVSAQWLGRLTRAERRAMILAVAAITPTEHGAVLERLLGTLEGDPVLGDLVQDKLLRQHDGSWQLLDPSMAEVVLQPLSSPALAAIRTAVARVLEGQGTLAHWRHQDAVSLYSQAGRWLDAARLEHGQALETVDPAARDRCYERALLLCQRGGGEWTSMWSYERGVWAARCGWLGTLGDVIAQRKRGRRNTAQISPGVVVEDAILDAEMAMLWAHPTSALNCLDSSKSKGFAPNPGADRLVEAMTIDAMLRRGELEACITRARPLLETLETRPCFDSGPTRVVDAAALAVCAETLYRAGQRQAAAILTQRRVVLELERGDRMGAARALLQSARHHERDKQPSQAAALLEEVEELIAHLGPVSVVVPLRS